MKVEQCLDADLFLDKYAQWKAGSPKHPVILQGMFAHAEMIGQMEFEWAICHGHWQSYPGLDPKVEVPAIQLVTTRDEIQELYNDVFQLKRSPGPLLYSLE